MKNLTFEQLGQLLASLGAKPYLANYVFSFIHQKHCTGIDDFTTLPKDLRRQLIDSGFCIGSLTVKQQQTDPDGTIKYLFETTDALPVESVLIADNIRQTACISSQVGCRMACTFCATGMLKFKRNLTASEIVDQVYQLQTRHGRISNVVYMGMGEPFDNFDNVIDSLYILNHPAGKNIGQRHITISTCGMTDGIEKFAALQLQVRLAVSLHAADDQTRKQIMAVTGRYPIRKIIAGIRDYQTLTNRRVTIEYCMIKDLNDSLPHAKELAHLLADIKCNVNLIQFNPFPPCPFEPSLPGRINEFAIALRNSGIETTIRFKKGLNIKAACGQLGAERIHKKPKPHPPTRTPAQPAARNRKRSSRPARPAPRTRRNKRQSR